MENSSKFVLAAYSDVGHFKYLYFCIITVLYLCIICGNALLIAVIIVDRELHEPMYQFVCNLSVNELYGSTALFPSLLLYLLSDIHEISRVFCIIQIFCIYTYATIEFCNLAIMAYDRYVSICHPLEYHNIMTPKKVYIYITFIWLYSFCKFTITLMLSVRLELCGNVMEKVYCDNYLLVKLACSDTKLKVNNIYGLTSMFFSVALPFLLILYSYVKVLKISLKSFKDSQTRALNTCIPHLIILTKFSFGCFFELIQSRFDMTHIPSTVRIVLSIYFILFPPLLNPIIYGVKTAKIRAAFKTIFFASQIDPYLGVYQ